MDNNINIENTCEQEELDELGLAQSDYFRLDSQEKIDWYIGKVNSMRADLERVKANSKSLIASLEKRLESFENLFRAEFIEAIDKLNLIPEGKKSYKSLQGTVQFRSVPDKIVINSPDEIPAEYCKEVIKLEPNKDAIKDALIKHGEVIPGVEIIPRHDELYIK